MGSKDKRILGAASQSARKVSVVQYDALELPQAQEAGKAAVVFAQAAEDREGRIGALNEIAMFYCYQGDGQRAQRYARRALTIPDVSLEQEATAHLCLGRALGLLTEKRNSATHLDKAREIGADLPPSHTRNSSATWASRSTTKASGRPHTAPSARR